MPAARNAYIFHKHEFSMILFYFFVSYLYLQFDIEVEKQLFINSNTLLQRYRQTHKMKKQNHTTYTRTTYTLQDMNNTLLSPPIIYSFELFQLYLELVLLWWFFSNRFSFRYGEKLYCSVCIGAAAVLVT